MAVRKISTAIELDGGNEFKKQLDAVNGELKNLKSEMSAVTAEFKGNANSMDALEAKGNVLKKQYEQQQQKVDDLTKAVSEATKAYDEGDPRLDKYRQSLNYAKAALANLDEQLQKNDQYMDEAKRSTDNCASSIDEFGREIKDAGKKAKDAGDDFKSPISAMDDFTEKLGDLSGLLAGGAAVGGATALVDSILGVVDSTEEYRRVMGTLETSSQAAGYSAEETAQTYNRLYSVLGDTETAATTVANLQAIGLSQEQLMVITDAAIGGWAQYGSSIPIDALAEGINETIQAGTATSTFSDLLVWAGVNEDEFNEKLQAANSSTERANIVMQELARQGLAETGQAWIDNNADIVTMNESQAELEAAMGRMGELLSPLASKLVSFGADALEFVIGKVKAAVDWFTKLNRKLNESGQARIDAAQEAREANENGSHALGLDYVPFDGYRAVLHQGEAVLTASENRALETLRIAGLPAAQPARPEPVMSAMDMNSILSAMVPSGGQQDLVLNITMEMDGDVLARKQLRYNARQQLLAGTSMIDGGM